jgi:glucose/arabinose dehydrogenase
MRDITDTLKRELQRFGGAVLVAVMMFSTAAFAQEPKEEDYYVIQSFEPREGQTWEVSGLTQLKDGRMMFCTREGYIYIIDKAYGDEKEATFKEWAFGLSSPLGLLELNGWIYCMQRGELTRMKDSTGDGRADVFETVNDFIPISGNYHEYNFGPRLDKDGKLWVVTNKPFGGEPYGKALFRGWAFRFDPETGDMETMVCGLRSPAGLEASPDGEMFYTDNQGEWCNASKLAHMSKGEFHGHPHGIESAKQPESTVPFPGKIDSGTFMKDMKAKVPTFKMPAVWFPYNKMGKSPCGMRWDTTDGKFGPYAGQLFVSDQNQARVMRVFLEKVDGHWQGACIPFRKGFQCGILRLAFGQDNSMFVGMSNAGWGGAGNRPWGLQRLVWTGKVPFDVHESHAKPDGFEFTFTHPVDKASVENIANYKVSSYTYKLRSAYGGPEEDVKTLTVTGAKAGADGKSVQVSIDGLRAGYVHEFHFENFKAADGTPLLHKELYYTLVNIPKQ